MKGKVIKKQSILIPLSFPRKRESTASSFWIPVFTGMTLYLLAGLVSSVWAGTYSGGDGSPENPYQIATAEDMNEIGANPDDWDAHFLLVADINLSDYTGTQFNIIGYFESYGSPNSVPFTGVFDGNDHRISNFAYTITDTDCIGLFGYVDDANAVVKDLTLIAPNVAAGNSSKVGSLVGWLKNGTINICGVDGVYVSSIAGWSVGGLVGENTGTIEDCYATGDVTKGTSYIGGLVGRNDGGTITNCYSTGSAGIDSSFADYIGGLVGYNHGEISNCYAIGKVWGDSDTGGLVGIGDANDVTSSFWNRETTGQSTSAGGEGKTTAEMQMVTTFISVGWDFEQTWDIDPFSRPYPFFKRYPDGDLNRDNCVDMVDFAIFASHWLEGTTP